MEKTLTELLQEYDNHTIQGTTPSKSWISNLLKEMRRSSVCTYNIEYPSSNYYHFIDSKA